MLMLIEVLQVLAGIGSLVCFILVIVRMFQEGETVMAVVCLVLILCCIGGLVAFISGWINSRKWGISNIMLVWTGLITAGLLLRLTVFWFGGPMIPWQE